MRRRKPLYIGLGLLLAMANTAAAGGKGAQKASNQTVEGEIQAGTDQTDGCLWGITRRVTSGVGDVAPNGTLAWRFEVDPKTQGGPFVLKGGAGDGVDLDITYYGGLRDPRDGVSTDSDALLVGEAKTFSKRKTGGELGIVPKFATEAAVCIYDAAADQTLAPASPFKYVAEGR